MLFVQWCLKPLLLLGLRWHVFHPLLCLPVMCCYLDLHLSQGLEFLEWLLLPLLNRDLDDVLGLDMYCQWVFLPQYLHWAPKAGQLLEPVL